MKKIVIVGAGPGGIAAAYKLSEKAEVILIDEGKPVMERICPSQSKCISCKACDKSKGFGGVGSFSDGKFIFETLVGKRAVGSNLHEIIGEESERDYIIQSRKFFEHFFDYEIEVPKNGKLAEAREISRIAAINDMDYIYALQTHIGTDNLPKLMKKIEDELIAKGVNIITRQRVESFDSKKVHTKKQNIKYDNLVISPGREGSLWLEELLSKNKIEHGYRAIDVGFRIETDAAILNPLVKVSRDVKFSFIRPNGDQLRTFCVCPNGLVTRETHADGFNLVNGESNSKYLSENSNFALLVTMPLRYNAGSNRYGRAIAEVFYQFGADKLTLQRFGDLKLDRSSKPDKINEWRVKPTLKDVRIGDVGGAMPYRLVRDLIWGIERLSATGLMEGLAQDSTLVYAPEIKFHGLQVKTDKYLQTTMPNVYLVGDGAGMSRGIVEATASGLLAADGILNNL